MKKNLLISLKLTLVLLAICCVVYPLLVSLAGKATKGGGDGETVLVKGKTVGYARIGQKFTQDKYFWSRPSAVDYNAAGSGGSNKGPTNPEYLKQVQARIDSFLAHNPSVRKEDIPSDLVTASGSGLDPNISVEGAYVQVARIAFIRHLPEEKIKQLVESHIEKNPVGPDVINVLKLNLALDQLKQ